MPLFFDGTYRTLHFLLLLRALDFCLWDNEHARNGAGRRDPEAGLAEALRSAFVQGTPLWSTRYLSRISRLELACLLDGARELQLMETRVAMLNQLGQKLLERYEGNLKCVIWAAGDSAPRLVGLLAEEFAAFRDIATYAGREVQFAARAQALVGDVHQAFNGTRWGHFAGMDQLAGAADQQLAQALCALEALSLSPSLASRVAGQTPLAPGGAEEVELRACSLWAVHLAQRWSGGAGVLRERAGDPAMAEAQGESERACGAPSGHDRVLVALTSPSTTSPRRCTTLCLGFAQALSSSAPQVFPTASAYCYL
ncbi:MAG: hypothetical protein EXR47_07670 [Dehalococcoidia bacterium]|nr:hypothetical protein [Dehalococcoidia bacterium]